jgi:hypothetical protein
MGLTRNLGDFNSVKFDVGISLPCKPEEKEQTFNLARSFVEEKMKALKAEILGPKKPQQPQLGSGGGNNNPQF